MAKIITQTRQGEDGTTEYVYPRTYALAVFLNNGKTSILDTIGSNWSTSDKDLKTCSDTLSSVLDSIGNWNKNNDNDKDLKTCSDNLTILIPKVQTLESQITTLESQITTLESQITTLTTDLQNKTTTLQNQIVTLTTDLQSLASRVSSLEQPKS